MDLSEILSGLHTKTAELLLKKIESGEASAAEIAQAIALLKHNNITATADDSKELQELQQNIASRRKRSPLRVVNGLDMADME